MLAIFERLRRSIIHQDWVLIESHTGVWNLNHGGGGLTQKFLFYNLEFCPQLNEYRLTTVGKGAKKHRIYGDLLTRLAEFNTGTADDDFKTYKDKKTVIQPDQIDEIKIVTFPLDNAPDKVWDIASDEQVLVDAMIKHLEVLKKDGVEVFERRHNMVATDIGYFAAVWLKNIQIDETPDDGENKEDDEK